MFKPTVFLFCILAGGTAAGAAQADRLPLRDGRYAQASFPCDSAPMAVSDFISHGKPVRPLQYGTCRASVSRQSGAVYIATFACSKGGPDDPPATTYKIIDRKDYTLQTKFGTGRYRWCGRR